jgi:hypothetical protein
MAKDDFTKEELEEIDKEARRRVAIREREEQIQREKQPVWKDGDPSRRKGERRKVVPVAPKKKPGFFD